MRKLWPWLVVAPLVWLGVTVGPAQAGPDDGYVVRLTRGHTVGERYHVTARGRQRKKERVTKNAQVVKDTESLLDVELKAVAEVQGLDSKRQATKVAYTIQRCVKTVAGQATEVVAPGRVVVVEDRGGGTHFTIDGAPADNGAREALAVVISGHAAEAATDDEIFGTSERKRVGDEWGINADAAARDLSSRGVTLDATRIRGVTKLAEVRREGGLKVLELQGRFRVQDMPLPLPSGAQVERSYLEGLFGGVVPADPKLPRRVAESMILKTGFTVRMKKPGSDDELVVEAAIEQGHQAQFRPVKR